ncbi:DUF748 domain-containing protein (plasmid) [Pedobacter sp. BS3]|uniref:DUF748 domain-containing protein n=1 Tax=Pedobacter sp. BS3 TaxID=2567937 RepID=UPI0011ED7B11|nr:DUF748 domain-containing protein [Pedobacter sp. BS3]TZF85649.1 DUF748 domain-containing protein [Pedobacter sp. BS3]
MNLKFTNKLKALPVIWKWLIGILLVLILALCTVAFYLSQHWKPVITEKIKQAVTNSTDSLYSISFSDISLNLITGNVSFKNVVFKADTNVYKRLQAKGDAPQNLFKIKLDALYLKRIHPGKIYFRKELDMNSIVISRPVIRMFYHPVKSRPDTTDNRTAYQRLSKILKKVKIQNIVFQDVDFKYIDKSYAKARVTGFDSMSIKITDLLIDSLAHRDKSRFYYTKDIFVQLKNQKFVTRDGLYTLRLDEVSSSTKDKYLRLKNFRVIPNYPDLQFSRKYQFQHDRYDIAFDEIMLNNVDFVQLNTQRRLIASGLILNGARVNVFMNRELPRPEFNKGRNYPHLALRRMPINTRIDTVFLNDIQVNYTEFNPKTERRGTVSFGNLHGKILHVTNDSASLAANHWAKADLSALLMNRGALHVNINFNLTDKNAAFNYNGTLGQMDMRALNPLARALAMVEISSGKIGKTEFAVDADYNGSKGTLKLYYNDLKIGILKKQENNTLKKSGVISLLANVLVIKNNNPEPGEPLRVGKISFVRPYWASFFNLMWKSVFVGLKESVGLDEAKEASMQERAKKAKNDKVEREERRTERKKHREERRKEREQKKQEQEKNDDD